MNSARNRNAVIADDTFQIQDWLRSNGNHDRGYPEFDYHQRIRPLSPVKRHRISTTDGRVPDRRRQLKSMESLLGLSDENLNGKNLNSEAVTRASPDVQDSLDRALMDFEETLELAFQSNSIVPPPRGFTNHNFIEADESNLNKLDTRLDSSFESNVTGSSGYSTKPDQSMHRSLNTYNELQLIREQMVKSLEIIKDLEEQVKLVPLLKAQVSSLHFEKQQLSLELEKHKKMESINKTTTGIGGWSSSTLPMNRRGAAATTKEVGVNCVPMYRDVGVTTQALVTAAPVSAGTSTTITERVSAAVAREATTACTGRCRRPPPKPVATGTQTLAVAKPVTLATGTQTAAAATVKSATSTVGSQTAAAAATVVVAAKPAMDVNTQTTWPTIRTVAVGVTARPRTYDVSVTAKPTSKHIGCTADLQTTDVQPVAATAPVPVPVTRTTQTDAAATPVRHVRTTQTDAATTPVRHARTTQTDVAATLVRHARTTQTEEDRAVVAAAPKKQLPDRHSGGRPSAATATIGRRSNSFHHYTAATAVDEAATCKEPPTTPLSPVVTSKIPRLKPVTPELNRKVLTRQDTYTKTTAEICSDQPPRVPDDEDGGDGDDNDNDDDDDQVNVKIKELLSSTLELQNGLPESDMNFKPIQEDLYKDSPSKEMKGALKVLNDSLKKTSATLLPRTQLKQAIDIVREEWFKVTSSKNCGGHLVKNYVNWFTSYSPVLLEFIINMTDAAASLWIYFLAYPLNHKFSIFLLVLTFRIYMFKQLGNTVLHYAISHGNFDVVSTILDTGLCNVNLTNDAGYSSVMLVSLADIKNDDEMKIIKRLFRCGDVNLQAQKHGQTTLMLAVSHGKTEVVKLLLECGADLNMQDEDGSTALMCAAEHGLQEIVNILLSCPECDVSIADNDGSTALSIAMEAGHKEIGIALYAKQHILSRENSPFNLSKTKRSRSANTVMPSSLSYSHLSLKKSPSLQPREYATLSSMLKTRTP